MTTDTPEVPNPFEGLADYLTDATRVSRASVCLEIGGAVGAEANAFFMLRNSFNVTGYATAAEALIAIMDAFDQHLIDRLRRG